ncbi:hypothetical protein ACRU43_02565 [Mycobacterium colombiense]
MGAALRAVAAAVPQVARVAVAQLPRIQLSAAAAVAAVAPAAVAPAAEGLLRRIRLSGAGVVVRLADPDQAHHQ